jgi:hypothetical protein
VRGTHTLESVAGNKLEQQKSEQVRGIHRLECAEGVMNQDTGRR